MAAFIIACVLLPNFLILVAAAASSSHIINLNQRLHADAALGPSAWYSPSRRFAFGFLPHDEGRSFLVAIWFTDGGQNTVIWTANRDDPPAPSNSTIELTASGKLLLNSGTPIADPPEPVAFASILDSGNLVLYGQNWNPIWQSFDYPTDTIVNGQKLASGNQLISRVSPSNYSTGRFRLNMQMDGNLVAYPLNTADAYWASGMNGYNHLLLDKAGRLKLVGERSSTQLNANYSGDAMYYRLTLDPDGVFRVYSHERAEPLWEALNDTCQVKSFCGFNSYCTSNDMKPICYCVPGTVDNGDGCRSNFTKQACRDGKAEITTYNITVELKLKWDDAPYFVGPMSSEDDCKKSCLEDCDCDAAEYDSVNCNKHKFPLRDVSRDSKKDSTTLFKVGTIRSFENGGSSSPAVKKKTMTNWKQILVLVSCLVAYTSIALVLFAVFAFKTRVLEYKRLLESSASGLARELTVRSYSYNELKVATRGFKEELGKGSFGAVYKGTEKKIGSGEKVVAVKRLQKLVEEGEREFQAEMRVIGKTHHKNLVRLLGYCTEGSNRMLVYEYMSNGSLADLLFRSPRRPDWHDRVRIALDVAKGILYLHEECEAPIIHCDIKPQNILMDEFWNAKISDFGLAKLLMPDQTRTFTDARGTRGYLAPEWHYNLPISLKVDVYCYGVVLLEIICCRKSIDLDVGRPEEIQLSGWAYTCFAQGQLSRLVGDQQVADGISLERMVSVALWCIQADPVIRPSMKGVVLMLQGFTTISTPPPNI